MLTTGACRYRLCRMRFPLPAARALLVVLLLLAIAGPRPVEGQVVQQEPPAVRLVLLIAVDQFRFDYLTRFRSEFRHGLDTLLTRGAVFTDAHLEHAQTVTAVGHATMLSGAWPSVSGIIGNSWYERETSGSVNSVTDLEERLLGQDDGEPSSPRRLLVSTLADEIKIAAGRSPGVAPKAIGVSMKARSAILPVGRTADAAYWFEGSRFVSSTWYMPALPAWVDAFNARRLPESHAGKRWTFGRSSEGHDLPTEAGARLFDAVYTSPFGNDILLALAREALAQERLGQRGVTDVFSVSFSSNDAVGHRYGPDSPEVHDITVKTDAVIGELLQEVDRLVGLSHTVVIFTTDHGVAPVPETANEQRLPGGRFQLRTQTAAVQQALSARFGEGRWVLASGSSVYLNHALIAERELEAALVRRVAADAVQALPHVARVYTREQLVAGGLPDDRISQRAARSYHVARSGDIEVILEPYWMRASTGTTHGSPWGYDAHIPLILMGPGVAAGLYHQHAALNDVAPTLAAILGVATPTGSAGRVLGEALAPTTAVSAQPLRRTAP
jgi:hypothetical protein